VRGTVTAAAGGTGLPGAAVSVYNLAGTLVTTGTTAANGSYEVEVATGAYRLLAYDPNGVYATVFYGNAESYDTTAAVQVGVAGISANFALPTGGRFRGIVESSPSGPIAGAVVDAYNLSGTRRASTTTNGFGEFSLVLPPGDYKVFAYDVTGFFAGEFAANTRSFHDAQILRIHPTAITAVDFVLERAALARGTLLDAATRLPLAGKTVYAYAATGALEATTTTDASGVFRFFLGSGQYRFAAGDPARDYGPAFYVSSRSFERSDVVTLATGEQRTNLSFAAQRAGRISGSVAAASRLTVAAYNLDGTLHASTTTNDAGRFDLVVAPGDYKLAVFDPAGAYATQFYRETLTFAGATTVTALTGQTTTALEFQPSRAGRLTGTVTAADTSQPLGGMIVASYDAAGAHISQTATAPNGTYTMAISPGEYRLVVFDTRFDFATAYIGGASSYEASAPRSVAPDQNTIVDFVMARGVRVTGVAREQDGTLVDGLEVFAVDGAGNRVAGGVTSGGTFTLSVVPGTYRLTTRDARHRFKPLTTQPLTVGSTPPAAVTLTLTPTPRRRATRS
jgi:hypothetical protein